MEPTILTSPSTRGRVASPPLRVSPIVRTGRSARGSRPSDAVSLDVTPHLECSKSRARPVSLNVNPPVPPMAKPTRARLGQPSWPLERRNSGPAVPGRGQRVVPQRKGSGVPRRNAVTLDGNDGGPLRKPQCPPTEGSVSHSVSLGGPRRKNSSVTLGVFYSYRFPDVIQQIRHASIDSSTHKRHDTAMLFAPGDSPPHRSDVAGPPLPKPIKSCGAGSVLSGKTT